MNISRNFSRLLPGFIVILLFIACRSEKGENSFPEYKYEKAIERNVKSEQSIIESFDFERQDISKKNLLTAEALAFTIHTWEFYTYKGKLVEREFIVSSLPDLAKNLGISIDSSLLGKMNSSDGWTAIAEVKDYFYTNLYSENRILEACVYMRAVTRLYLCFSLYGLLNAIDKNDKQQIDVGNKMLGQGLAVAEEIARMNPPPRELQEQIMKLKSTVSSGLINNNKKAEMLQQEIESWFDLMLESQLTDWGGKKR